MFTILMSVIFGMAQIQTEAVEARTTQAEVRLDWAADLDQDAMLDVIKPIVEGASVLDDGEERLAAFNDG